jgi:hypothetical protein
VGDDEDRVLANRDLAGRAIERDSKWAVVKQVHGCDIVRASSTRHPADALWTDDPGRTIAVMAADCVPVLLVEEDRIAAAHAGWRGAAAGVVQAAAEAVGATRAWVGPAIGPCCFEVGGEVAGVFAETFGPSVIHEGSRVDLWAAVAVALEEAGVRETHIARLCTSCHPELFFSHRRDGGRTGRQALIARLP